MTAGFSDIGTLLVGRSSALRFSPSKRRCTSLQGDEKKEDEIIFLLDESAGCNLF